MCFCSPHQPQKHLRKALPTTGFKGILFFLNFRDLNLDAAAIVPQVKVCFAFSTKEQGLALYPAVPYLRRSPPCASPNHTGSAGWILSSGDASPRGHPPSPQHPSLSSSYWTSQEQEFGISISSQVEGFASQPETLLKTR